MLAASGGTLWRRGAAGLREGIQLLGFPGGNCRRAQLGGWALPVGG